MTTPMMSAIGIVRYGGPEVLSELRLPVPSIGPGQVLVRVEAAAVNPADAAIRSGQFRFFIRRPLPLVVGSDIAGTVHDLGYGATRFAVGDAVHGLLPLLSTGGYAQYAVIDESALAPVPGRLSMPEAAAVPLAALTALQALVDRGAVGAGRRVLITGASGGVGTFAVQMATALGAHVLTLTSGRNLELVSRLGARETYDYDAPDVLDRVGRVDVILDCARSLGHRHRMRLLTRGGTYISVVPFANPIAIVQAAAGGYRFRWVKVEPDGAALARIDEWIEQGHLRPVIERVIAPEQVRSAHEHIESRRTRGKIVLDLTSLSG